MRFLLIAEAIADQFPFASALDRLWTLDSPFVIRSPEPTILSCPALDNVPKPEAFGRQAIPGTAI
jgi:hypothetical protein